MAQASPLNMVCAGRLPHPILPPVGEGENESLCEL